MANDVQNEGADPWGDDLLGVKARGETFATLVQSIDDSKVISIEAGFGRGKTFFRQAWAKHLRAEGEVVIEIDAQKSDHSGDPVVTFIGALVEALGPKGETTASKLKKSGLKWAAVGGRAVAGAVIGRAVDGVIEAAGDAVAGDEDTSAALEELVDGVGDGLSKVAKQLIATQMKAEKARAEELPQQLDNLRFALTMKEGEDAEAKVTREEKNGSDRVVILIDELDRCHPDYVIALLEAMKLVFDRKGYVFVLMVNAKHLERLASHRFGKSEKDDKDDDHEEYLEKFVDIRLSLGTTDKVIGEAARALVLAKLDIIGVPFGEGPEFTVERAAEVAKTLAPVSKLPLRQIEKVLLKVEIALRCYSEHPLDAPLLVYLAFKTAAKDKIQQWENAQRQSRRQSRGRMPNRLLPFQTLRECTEMWPIIFDEDGRRFQTFTELGKVSVRQVNETASGLPVERFVAEGDDGRRHQLFDQAQAMQEFPSQMVEKGIQPWYLKDHQAILDATYELLPDEEQ